jgi:transposase-like protein
MLQIGSFHVWSSHMTTGRGRCRWSLSRYSAPTVTAHEVIKAGKQATGAQRYQCQNGQCARRIFLLQYQDRGRVPEVCRQVVATALNGSGVRDTARVLRIRPTTVIAVLKKSRHAATRQSRLTPPSSVTRRRHPRPTTARGRAR